MIESSTATFKSAAQKKIYAIQTQLKWHPLPQDI